MRQSFFRLWILMALIVCTADGAQALSLEPGYDLYTTTGGFLAVDFDGPGGFDPVPVPIASSPIDGSLFDTNLIMQRKSGADPFNVGDEVVVPVEMVALSLQSLHPVEFNSTFYDLKFRSGSLLSNPASPFFQDGTIPNNPDGTGTIKKLDPVGGTFSSFFDVFVEIDITDITDPNNTDTILEQYKLFIEQAPWVETPGHTYPSIPDFPGGNFYAQFTLAEGEGAQLNLAPASTPEPASMVLMMSGLIGLGTFRRKFS